MTRTGSPPASTKTSDLAICATSQPTAAAASAAVRVDCGSSTTRAVTPAASSADWTRSVALGIVSILRACEEITSGSRMTQLLVAQRLNGIELRRPRRRIDPRDQSDADGDA